MTLANAASILRSLINERLDQLIPLKGGPHALLYEAARYSLLLPGKRLRPLLLLSVLEGYHLPVEAGLDVACALEMIHTYSLIHDDLPCMDDDDLRRGKPTLHKVYGEGQAVLAGDYLLTHAFQILAQSGAPQEVISIIAESSGGEGMIGGQVVDLLTEGKETNWDTLLFMYLGKTAALFSAALEVGGVLAKVSYSEQTALRTAGKYFGVAYQIQDDLLDLTSDEETLGKPIGSDEKNHKSNCVTLFGLERAEELAQNFQEKALSALPETCFQLRSVMDI